MDDFFTIYIYIIYINIYIIYINIYILTADYTVKPVLSSHSKKKTKIGFLV